MVEEMVTFARGNSSKLASAGWPVPGFVDGRLS